MKEQIGIYKDTKQNFGFVEIGNGEEKISFFVHDKNKNKALDGDEVKFTTKKFRGREEAIITKILNRSEKKYSGTFYFGGKNKTDKSFGFVVLQNKFIGEDIYIKKPNSKILKNGDKVGVEIINWDRKKPEGKITENISKISNKNLESIMMAYESGARIEFPKKVLEESKKFNKVEKSEFKNRKDFTKDFVFTIDGEDTKDVDDAVSIEKVGKNYRLFVHIADVSNYVLEKSILDKEAFTRGTSIYFTNKVIPMLPENLSNGICSLNPEENRLTLTCEMLFDENGNTLETKIYESFIKSKLQLTYKDIEKITKNELKIGEKLYFGKIYDEILENSLKIAFELKNILYKNLVKNGYIQFETFESKIKTDEKDFPVSIEKREVLESHKLIEYFMIKANESVSKYFSKNPFLYRIHEKLKEENLQRILENAKAFLGEDILKIKKDSSLQKILQNSKGKNYEKYLSKLILSSLEKAKYSTEKLGHFGLGLEYYSHFTSPIRRYPDLQIHRIIKAFLHKNLDKNHFAKILPGVAEHTSEREIVALNIERNVEKMMKAKFMSRKIGEKFSGEIEGIIEKGIFVRLPNTVEGFITIENLEKFYKEKNGKKVSAKYDNLMNVIKLGQEIYKIGDLINIEVESVDLDFNLINFSLV